MGDDAARSVRTAEIVLPCSELDATLEWFTERLGFRLDEISPADDPSVAVVSGHGVRLRLERGRNGAPGVLRLACADPDAIAGGSRELTAPNGTRVELVPADPPLDVPPVRQSLFVSRGGDDVDWSVGRAGMQYRDLVPDRQGGRFIASNICIPDGGPVPDVVHFHEVRFQFIYCWKGWVRVVYEDQGEPFVLRAGDCVLQPPRIRHRVLEASPGLEVIELACPAAHATRIDHDMELPTSGVQADRDFGGQRFVRHEVADARWEAWCRSGVAGLEARDTGIAAATDGLASVHVVRAAGATEADLGTHEGELLFRFVLQGSATLRCEGGEASELVEGSSFVVPARVRHSLTDCTEDLELLEVALPAVALPAE